MNKLSLLLPTVLMCLSLLAQAPLRSGGGINYQTIIRDDAGNILPDTEISLQMIIRTGAPEGSIVYSEIHDVVTNAFGMINLEIGTGAQQTGNFEPIAWGMAPHYLETAVDLTGSKEFQTLGVVQLLSVPYAYHASSLTVTSTNGAKYGVGVDNEGNLFTYLIEESPCPTVTDIEGNTYKTAWINKKCWMAENLKVTRYNDNTLIDFPGANNDLWQNNTNGAYAWYNNQITYKDLYGALYNWYAVTNPKGLCPEGWHIPTQDEWNELEAFIPEPDQQKGNKLKSCRQVNSPLGGNCNTDEHPRWNQHNVHYGTDVFGFAALPGGQREPGGNTNQLGAYSWWWSSTILPDLQVHARWMFSGSGGFSSFPRLKNYGLSVRCVKD
jgi:uncharacterized protein (TIGR02145 family)